jgi:hypothetical protein
LEISRFIIAQRVLFIAIFFSSKETVWNIKEVGIFTLRLVARQSGVH